eukprot:7090510-Lingulodinium_polyedra.AAC.1
MGVAISLTPIVAAAAVVEGAQSGAEGSPRPSRGGARRAGGGAGWSAPGFAWVNDRYLRAAWPRGWLFEGAECNV